MNGWRGSEQQNISFHDIFSLTPFKIHKDSINGCFGIVTIQVDFLKRSIRMVI